MDGGHAAVVAGIHGLQHVERLAAADLTDDDTVWAHAQGVAHEIAEFDWGFWHLVQDQTFYAVRLDSADGIHFDGLEPMEKGTIDQAAWWTADALDADGTAANDNLTTMMRAAVRQILGDLA